MGFFRQIRSSVRAFAHELKHVGDISSVTAESPTIGIALAGGFARGVAHIGVLKVLEKEGIRINFVAGTSAGALIGAAYCSGVSARELEKIASLVRFKDFGRRTISRFGLYNNDRMTSFLKRVLKAKTFEELRIPLAVTATDFSTGEAVIFRKGDLIDPIRASCAYPGIFLPVKVEGRILVDGLLAHCVPVKPLREMGAEKVIAVYFRSNWVQQNGPRHVLDVIGQCFSIAQANLRSLWQSEADLLIEPDVGSFAFDAFESAPDLIRLGEEAARKLLPVIRSWMSQKEKPTAEAASNFEFPVSTETAKAKS